MIEHEKPALHHRRCKHIEVLPERDCVLRPSDELAPTPSDQRAGPRTSAPAQLLILIGDTSLDGLTDGKGAASQGVRSCCPSDADVGRTQRIVQTQQTRSPEEST